MRYEAGFPMPHPTPTSQPYWDGLREHRILIQYSPSSDTWVFYPRVRTPFTLADDLEWRQISGAGTLYTYTITSKPTAPPWAESLPQQLAIVQWPEGPRVSTELVETDGIEIRIGMPLAPVFVDIPDTDITLLRYRPLS